MQCLLVGRLLLRSREATDWKTGGKGLVVTIADTGSGISTQAKMHLFEPFFTTKGSGGNGLGLWISEEIISRHNGRIKVKSSTDQRHAGSVVSIFLPFEAGLIERGPALKARLVSPSDSFG